MTKTEVKLLDGRGGRGGRPFVEVARVFDTGRERVWQALTAKTNSQRGTQLVCR